MDLLQYRLREWAKHAEMNKCSVENIIAKAVTHGEKGNLTCSEQIDFAYKLADEIERDYIPKAVDANGDVWHIGNPCIIGGKEGIIAGYAYNNCSCVWVEDDGGYDFCGGEYIQRPEERTPIEKLRDEMRDYAHGNVPDSVLDGWVKDLTAYIDQQGKDE